MNGSALLAEFKQSGSERAFADLVRRHTNLVYSVARRRTGNDASAQEITQLVFIQLARNAPALRDEAELLGWLHRITVNQSINLWRSESRRRAREEHAATMQTNSPDNPTWHAVAPALDEALNAIPESDRQAILLRYFLDQSMRETGSAFGISEDAAKKRVGRALDRLRDQLARHGVTCGAGALGTLLTERALEAAPGPFAEALAAARYPAATGAAGLLGFALAASKAKLAAVLAVTAIVGGTLFFALGPHGKPQPRFSTHGESAATPFLASAATSNSTTAGPDATTEASADANNPDPLMLLLRVAQGRQRLVSGTMEWTLFIERFETVGKPAHETNHSRFEAAFDGSKLWLETFRREYGYVQVGRDAAKTADPIIESQGLDREGAVRAGLLRSFESHRVTAADGTNWMYYENTDGRPGEIVVRDPEETANGFTDFRCLGLQPTLFTSSTVENCLGYIQAKSIKLAGRESVNGIDAWRVSVVSRYDQRLDYWIDVAHPERLLKQSHGLESVVSQFDPNSRDAMPIRVHAIEYSRSKLVMTMTYTRRSATFNEPVDPKLWTMAGLGAPIGAAVIDHRVSRRIGYWDGAGLASSPPKSKPRKADSASTPSSPPVNREELLATLETAPDSEEGFAAAEWLLLNTPDGAEVERAAEAVQQHHLTSPRLGRLAHDLERFRHRSARPLLEGMLARNPRPEIQAAACYTLATLVYEECDYGMKPKVAGEAEQWLERVIREFASVMPEGPTLAHRAERNLSLLREASFGKMAPEFTAVDLDQQEVRLSDFRGQHLFLNFWSGSFSEQDEQRGFEEVVAGKPIKFLGISCDRDAEKTRTTIREKKITGRQIWDGREGPISKAWHIDRWPCIFLLDPTGKIIYRGSYSHELFTMLPKLFGE